MKKKSDLFYLESYHARLQGRARRFLSREMQKGTKDRFYGALSLAYNLGLLVPFSNRRNLDMSRAVYKEWLDKIYLLESIEKAVKV